MKFFKAQIESEAVYFRAVTWCYARAIGRLLWPMECMEDIWSEMRESAPPPKGKKVLVYERDEDSKEVVVVAGYEFDPIVNKKRKKRSAK